MEIIDWMEGQADCRAGREEKSKPAAKRLRETAERTGTAETGAELGLEGRERASATMFYEPGTWTISLVNLEM